MERLPRLCRDLKLVNWEDRKRRLPVMEEKLGRLGAPKQSNLAYAVPDQLDEIFKSGLVEEETKKAIQEKTKKANEEKQPPNYEPVEGDRESISSRVRAKLKEQFATDLDVVGFGFDETSLPSNCLRSIPAKEFEEAVRTSTRTLTVPNCAPCSITRVSCVGSLVRATAAHSLPAQLAKLEYSNNKFPLQAELIGGKKEKAIKFLTESGDVSYQRSYWRQ